MSFRLPNALFLLYLFVCACFISSNLSAQQVTDQVAPESGNTLQSTTKLSNTTQPREAPKLFKEFIVASANPLASQAAFGILERGGSAIDAMVTIQTVLGLVEPQSSGLGGGAFLVYYDAKNKTLTTYDGRETSPTRAPNDLFMKDEMTPMAFFDAVVGGRSVGTPGTVKLLWETHKKYGNKHSG